MNQDVYQHVWLQFMIFFKLNVYVRGIEVDAGKLMHNIVVNWIHDMFRVERFYLWCSSKNITILISICRFLPVRSASGATLNTLKGAPLWRHIYKGTSVKYGASNRDNTAPGYESVLGFIWCDKNDLEIHSYHCPACRTTFIATRFRVAVICPIIPVPHCIRVFFYFVWFVFINHIFQFYYELCTYCNILDIYLS